MDNSRGNVVVGDVKQTRHICKRQKRKERKKEKNCSSTSSYLSNWTTFAFPKHMHGGLYQYVFISVRTHHTLLLILFKTAGYF